MKTALYFHSHRTVSSLLDYYLKIGGDTIFFNSPLNIKVNCAQFHGTNIWKWNDRIIATCTHTALFLLNCPVPKEKYLYIHDINEWQNGMFARQNIKAYKSLPIIADKVYHDRIYNVWRNENIITLEDLFNG